VGGGGECVCPASPTRRCRVALLVRGTGLSRSLGRSEKANEGDSVNFSGPKRGVEKKNVRQGPSRKSQMARGPLRGDTVGQPQKPGDWGTWGRRPDYL